MTIPNVTTGQTIASAWGNAVADEVNQLTDDVIDLFADTSDLQTQITNHLNDITDAHDASAISYGNLGSGLTAIQVQAALDELKGLIDVNSADIAALEINDAVQDADIDTLQADVVSLDGRLDTAETDINAVETSIADHLADTVDAHDASAISYAGGPGLSATNVETAIDELADEKLNKTGGTLTGALILDVTDEVTLSGGSGVIRVGLPSAGQHIAIDSDEIQSKATATTAGILNLNPHGGVVRVATAPAASTDVARKTETDAVQTNLTNHLNDTADAHAASAITNTPAGTVAATTVQAAINELDTEKATTGSVTTVQTNLDNHIDDTVDAHDATAISYAGSSGLSATTVEAGLDELDSEKFDKTGGAITGEVTVVGELGIKRDGSASHFLSLLDATGATIEGYLGRPTGSTLFLESPVTNTDLSLRVYPGGTPVAALKLRGTDGAAVMAGKAVVESTEATALTSGTGALNIGAIAGNHIAIGDNNIQSKSDATTARTLDLNPGGGLVNLGAGGIGYGGANIFNPVDPITAPLTTISITGLHAGVTGISFHALKVGAIIIGRFFLQTAAAGIAAGATIGTLAASHRPTLGPMSTGCAPTTAVAVQPIHISTAGVITCPNALPGSTIYYGSFIGV